MGFSFFKLGKNSRIINKGGKKRQKKDHANDLPLRLAADLDAKIMQKKNNTTINKVINFITLSF